MSRGARRKSILLLLLALGAAGAGAWLALTDAAAMPDALAHLFRPASSGDDAPGPDPNGAVPGSAHDGPGDAKRRRSRNRAGQPVVMNEDEARRAAAVQKLVDDVAAAAAAKQAEAQNIRRMDLPGVARRDDPDWAPSAVRLDSAGAARPATTALRARPGSSRVGTPSLSGVPIVGESLGGGRRTPREGASDDGEETPPAQKGLRADYYDFLDGEILEVPALAELPPSFTRIDKAIDFATDESFELPFEPETFATLWRGYLVCDVEGDYEFTLGSDDGMRLRIDDATVAEFTFLRPYAETSGAIHLTAGRHKIEVGFYENYVFASARLFWKTPGSREKVVIPRDAFEPPDDVAAAEPPVLGSLEPASGMIGDEIVLRGRGFSASPALNRVTFAGVPAEVVSASETELVVTVPLGASTGGVVVQVGPISTRPRTFDVENLLGLFAEYYLIGTELLDYPDFAATAPYFVRVDGPVDFPEDDLWKLPYEPDVFAARWFGWLYVPEDDEYEITLGSDDGAQLSLDGAVFVDLPGLHPYEEAASRAHFTAGFHKLEMKFFENYGGALMRLFWKRRGDAARVPIPRGFLFAPDEIAIRAEPSITALEPASAVSGDEIVVRGGGFGTSPEFVRVEFPGDVWVRPSFVSDDVLRVRVPRGAGTGEVRVHAGIRTSLPTTFTLGEAIGLRADFYELAPGEVVDVGNLPAAAAARSVTESRIDTRFRFGTPEAWGTRVATGDFLVHWSGTVSVETAQSIAFAVQSESSVLVRVNGADVMSDLDPHTLRENFGSTRLAPGEHAIDVWLLGRGGTGRLHVFYTPFGRADHLELPATWLRPRSPR